MRPRWRATPCAPPKPRPPTRRPPAAATPCLLARASSAGILWQGCAGAALAQRVLAAVPRLTLADRAPRCATGVCQVRLVRTTPPARHARYGLVAQDLVFDRSGAFSCATPAPDAGDTPNVLRVVRGRVRPTDADALFSWLMDDVAVAPGRASTSAPLAASGVYVRGAGGAWNPLAPPQATLVSGRWSQTSGGWPSSCRR